MENSFPTCAPWSHGCFYFGAAAATEEATTFTGACVMCYFRTFRDTSDRHSGLCSSALSGTVSSDFEHLDAEAKAGRVGRGRVGIHVCLHHARRCFIYLCLGFPYVFLLFSCNLYGLGWLVYVIFVSTSFGIAFHDTFPAVFSACDALWCSRHFSLNPMLLCFLWYVSYIKMTPTHETLGSS